MDDLIISLQTAARRFCEQQFSHWADEYRRLEAAGKARISSPFGDWDYSKHANSLFPRYRLNEAIQIEVERLNLQSGSLQQASATIIEAARIALSPLLKEFKNSTEATTALNDEAESFTRYVATLHPDDLRRVPPLPYRRVLLESEGNDLWKKLQRIWLVPSRGYWYPLSECPPNLDMIAFHDELWQSRDGTQLLRNMLRGKGIERCLVLRENPPDFELESSSADPAYDGDECFITSDFEWLVYASHESSITVAGWLADAIRKEWKDWDQVTYRGPFHTADLRGTWNFPE